MNDITEILQAAAAKGGSGKVTLSTGTSVFRQCVKIDGSLEIAGQGRGVSTLQMYGKSTPVNVGGFEVTGPAGWFLKTDGTPLGPPGLHANDNPLKTWGNVNGVYFHDFTFDDNIHIPSDTWAGAVAFFEGGGGFAVNPRVENFEIINAYGGINLYPDPIHVNAPGMTVKNYRMTNNAIPPNPTAHGGVPGGLIFGAAGGTPGIVVEDVDVVGFLEFDVTPCLGIQLTSVKATHCLIGNQHGATSWGGAVWDGVTLYWPSATGPVLNFSPGVGGPYTDWTIKNSSILDRIANDDLFQGTWGPGNTPATLP